MQSRLQPLQPYCIKLLQQLSAFTAVSVLLITAERRLRSYLLGLSCYAGIF